MKKIFSIMFVFILFFGFFIQTGIASSALQKITVALNQVNLEVNGEKVDKDTINYNGTTYVPLRAIGEILNKDIGWDQDSNTASVNDKGFVSSELKQTKDGITVEITKVEQDSDSLRVYVTYINKTDGEVMTGDSLSKIVANGTQYDYNSEFNFERYYGTNSPKASDYIEMGVTDETVIFFEPVSSDTINIVINADFIDFRFNNVKVQ